MVPHVLFSLRKIDENGPQTAGPGVTDRTCAGLIEYYYEWLGIAWATKSDEWHGGCYL